MKQTRFPPPLPIITCAGRDSLVDSWICCCYCGRWGHCWGRGWHEDSQMARHFLIHLNSIYSWYVWGPPAGHRDLCWRGSAAAEKFGGWESGWAKKRQQTRIKSSINRSKPPTKGKRISIRIFIRLQHPLIRFSCRAIRQTALYTRTLDGGGRETIAIWQEYCVSLSNNK